MTITKDAYHIVARLPAPGFRRELHELRFLKKDLGQLIARLEREAAPPPVAKESRAGIGAADVLLAFQPVVRIDLKAALAEGGGIFGDDGARVKGSAKKKTTAIWNPVTLALGLHEVHRIPLGPLKRAFATQACLQPWTAAWNASLDLLGK